MKYLFSVAIAALLMVLASPQQQILVHTAHSWGPPPLPQIAVIDTGNVGNADATNITPTIPTEAQTGDFMLLVVSQRDRIASSVSGWTLKDTTAVSATSKLGVWYKFHDGSEANPTVTHSGGSSICGFVLVFRNVEADDPFDVYGTYVNQNSDPGPNTYTTTEITTVTDSTLLIHLIGSEDNNTWSTPTGACDSLRGGWQYSNGSGTDNSIAIAFGRKAAHGATGTSALTQQTLGWDNGISVHFALKMNR